MVLGLFKKKEPDYDPTNLSVRDLKPGFVFEYDLRNWQVVESNTYDWGNDFFSKEHKITDGRQTLYLGVEEDDELELCLMEKLPVRRIDVDLSEEVSKNDSLPRLIQVDDETFVLEEEAPGYLSRGEDSDWVEFISWDYYSKKDEDRLLTIEQFGEREFEASIGNVIESYEISGINPA